MHKLTIISALLLASMTFAQEEEVVKEQPPAISSKHLVSIDGVFSYPLYYSRLNNNNTAFKHNLNWGGRVSYIYSPSKRFGVGLEYGVDVSKVDLQKGRGFHLYSLITSDYLSIKHEGMRLLVQQLMPKIEWKRGHSNRPGGLVHQFGIGVTVSKVLKGNYDYSLNYYDQSLLETSWVHSNDAEENFKEEQLYNYKNKPFIGGAVMYRIAYRGSISESLLWSVGLRSQMNVTKATFENYTNQFDEEDRDYWINRREMEVIVAINRLESFFQLDLGVSYHF